MKGLKPAIKDNLVNIINCPQTLHGWENINIQVDANIHQQEIEKCEESGRKPGKPSSDLPTQPTTATLPADTDIIPMEVDAVQTSSGPRGKLTPAEREYRIKNKLCLYCGKPGHVVADHPRKDNKLGEIPQGKVQPGEN